MKYDEKVFIYLKFIADDLNPKEITDLIGISPTKSGMRGEYLSGTKVLLSEGRWYYKYMVPPDPWNVGEAIETLLPLVESKPELIRYCQDKDIYIEFAVIMYLAENTPIVTLEPPLMRRIAEINADVDFDMYLMFDHDN